MEGKSDITAMLLAKVSHTHKSVFLVISNKHLHEESYEFYAVRIYFSLFYVFRKQEA